MNKIFESKRVVFLKKIIAAESYFWSDLFLSQINLALKKQKLLKFNNFIRRATYHLDLIIF